MKQIPGRKRTTKNRIEILSAALGALFCSLSLHWGRQLDRAGSVDFTSLSSWLWIAATAAAGTPLLLQGFRSLERYCARAAGQASDPVAAVLSSCRKTEQATAQSAARRHFLLTALALFVCWLPVFLAVYPGFFAYDATDELNQVLTGNYLTRHPLLHVLLLGKTVTLIQGLTGSYNTGIAVYVLAQMAGMALLLSWLLQELKAAGAGKWLRGLSFVFLAFFPVIPMYVLCTSKDMPYTAGMLAVLLLTRRLIREKEGFFAGKASVAGLGAGLFVMAVFRNNGFLVFLMMLPVLLWLTAKGQRRRMGVLLAVVLAAWAGQNLLLTHLLDPVDTGKTETFTVPIQQLARTWTYSPEVFTPEEAAALLEILPEENLRLYTPKLSDQVKAGFVTEAYEKDPVRYQKLWLSVGLKAPFTYMNAWLMTSYGFWYPGAQMDVYNGWRNYTESSYFSFETEEPGYRDSKFPWLEEQYRSLSWENGTQSIPVLSLLYAPGFLCWVWVLLGLYLAAAGKWKTLAAFLPVYCNLATVLLGPTYLVRYVLIFWFALPALLCYTTRD